MRRGGPLLTCRLVTGWGEKVTVFNDEPRLAQPLSATVLMPLRCDKLFGLSAVFDKLREVDILHGTVCLTRGIEGQRDIHGGYDCGRLVDTRRCGLNFRCIDDHDRVSLPQIQARGADLVVRVHRTEGGGIPSLRAITDLATSRRETTPQKLDLDAHGHYSGSLPQVEDRRYPI